MDYTVFAKTFAKMTLEQMREVNRLAIGQINELHRQKQAKALMRFKIGDLVDFVDSRNHRNIRARVEKINQKTVSAKEIDGFKTSWRVSPSMCKLVGA